MSEVTQVRRYKFEFLVKAKKWDRVVKIFADELDIREKRNSGDRQVSDYFFVTVELPEDKLTDDFYNSVKKSKKIAIVTDELSLQNGKKVIEEIRQVENCLRRLLLHTPDLIENYFSLFSASSSKSAKSRASNGEVISATDFDTITSHITFEDVLRIFEDDFSWLNHQPSVNDLAFLIENSSDLGDLKKKIKEKKKIVTVWAVVSKFVLEKPVHWSEVKKQLYTLKELRNTAAHFRTIQTEDVEKAKRLATEVMEKINRQKNRTATEELALTEIIRTANENLKRLTDTINNSLKPSVGAFVRLYNQSLIQTAQNAEATWRRALINSVSSQPERELYRLALEKRIKELEKRPGGND